MERVIKEVGQHAVFTDALGQRHDALITVWHLGEASSVEEFKVKYGPDAMPCVNLLFVTKDPKKTDPYGSQIERHTSVPHYSVQHAVNGMNYRWPHE
jgi:hypothetical protein